MEKIGIGDWLPDFTQTPLMKSIAGGLTAFKGSMQGLIEGKFGIQQPGTRVCDTKGAFGQPSIEVPPMPAPGEHPGIGAPPGPTVVNNDLSITYTGNTIGSDPAEVRRQNSIQQDNVPGQLTRTAATGRGHPARAEQVSRLAVSP